MNRKYTSIIIILILLIGGGVLSYKYWWLPKQEAVSHPEDSREKILQITEAVLKSIENKRFRDALPYFIYGEPNELTGEDILVTLALIEETYKEDGFFNPSISLENIEIVGGEGQALVEFTINAQRATIRFDFQKTTQGWKIMTITFGGELSLVETKEAEAEAEKELDQAIYSTSPGTFTLPNGDLFEIEKTLMSSKRDEFRFKMKNPQVGYVVALYEPPYIKSSLEVQAGALFTGFYTLDLGGLKGNEGIVLVYPGGTKIELKKSEINIDPLLQIPVQIQSD